jgi:gamma-glutamyl-gamma-aminobutyrate hydrolase PuuD
MTTRKPFILVLEGLSGAAECIDEAGGESYSISPYIGNMQIMHELFAEGCVDGLLLTGGGDVDPRRYGQTAHKETYGVSEDRDTVEFSAVRMARRYGLPRGASAQRGAWRLALAALARPGRKVCLQAQERHDDRSHKDWQSGARGDGSRCASAPLAPSGSA